MHKYLHITDIHLNFLTKKDRIEYYQELNEQNPTHIFLTGDIGEAQSGYYNEPPSTSLILQEMAAHVEAPIYFVLGNHDYYHGDVDAVRGEISELCHNHPRLTYLTTWGTVQLDEHTSLIGVDGWADAREGDYENSYVRLNDSVFISELYAAHKLGKVELAKQMAALADKDTENLDDHLNVLLWQREVPPKNIIILTHIPPYKEVALFRGEISNNEYLPFYVNWGLGMTLEAIAKEAPHVQFHVLCGHSHSEAHMVHPQCPNLSVTCGPAEYGSPAHRQLIIP